MVTVNQDLLEDVIIEILSRLPVKSLMRFRLVCKSWYDLVKSPSFIARHLKNDNTRLIVFYIDEDDGTDEFYYPKDFFCMFVDETLVDLALEDLDPHQPIRGIIGGPYDGIFCIFGINNRITLWNLATRESRTLPKCKVVFSHYTKVSTTNVGFGLDLVSSEYKLVLILTLWDEKGKYLHEFSRVVVYTLRTNSWRDAECFKSIHYHMPQSHDSTYLDGFCYWLLDLQDTNRKVVISFDMHEEVTQEIQEPSIPQAAHVTLGLYDGSLSLLVLNTVNNCFDVLVIKDRNWTKQLTVESLIAVRRPLGFWKKGAFFIESSSQQLLLYDPSTQEMRDLGLRSSWFSVNNYKESLLTIKREDNLFESLDIPWHVLGLYQTDT